MITLNMAAVWAIGIFGVIVGVLGIIFRNSKWMNN